jgi:hypothetical protein
LDLRGAKSWEAGEDCIMRSFTKCYLGDQIKENEIGGACSMGEVTHKKFWPRNLKGRDHWKT